MKSQNHNQLLIKKMSKNILLILLFPLVTFAQVGVNTTAPKAALDVESTNNGVLIPRVQLTSILDNTTIINPNAGPLVTSTLVYNMAPAGIAPNNVIAGFYYWNNSTSRWIAIAATSGWELDGNTAITSPAVPATYGTSTIGATENYIGTTDANDVTVGTNAIERMRVKNTTGNVGIGTASPIEKLHVFHSANANKSSFFSEARQTSAGSDFENIAIKGYGRGIPGWGNSIGLMGIGDRDNSYLSTGVFGHLGSTSPAVYPTTVQAIFANGNGETYNGTIHGIYSQATGTGPGFGTRIAGYFTASGGVNNYALIVPNNGGKIGFGTITPNAMVDIQSTNNGVLIPRIALTSITDALSVVNPAGGPLQTSTLIYNTATAGVSPNNVIPGFYFWNNPTSRWIALSNATDWSLNGNTAITSPAVPATYGTSTIGATENFMGTTDNNDVTIGTNNIERMRVLSSGNIGIGLATAPAKLSVFRNFASPTFPNTTTNAMVRIGSNNEGLDIGKGGAASNYAAWFQSGYNGAFSDPISFQPLGGNVGIGTTNPSLARFQVDGMTGNTTALFRGNSTTSQGISMVADWPGIYFNSYYNGAIRSMAGSGFTSIINTDQSSGGLVFQTTNVVNPASGTAIASVPVRMTISGAGNVGIGAPAPSNLLHVNSATSGAVRIVDGTQAAGRVLTSNATGVATWQPVAINNIIGNLSATGVTINYNTGPYLQTGSSITLPQGRFAVNVNMLMARNTLVISPNDSSFWVRSTFSQSPLANPAPSGHIVGSNLISGNHPGTSYYSMLTGTVIIDNPNPSTTYYYVAGSCVSANTTQNITDFGSTYWAENNIIAYRLN